jgi:signal transduction histidine kinase
VTQSARTSANNWDYNDPGTWRLLGSAAQGQTLVLQDRRSWWNKRHTFWVLGGVVAIALLSLGWVGMLRNQVRQRTIQLHAKVLEHQRTAAQLEAEIVARKRMQLEVEQTQQELLAASRHAGMAEVATSVLHNVGNVLNSINVSAFLLADGLRKFEAASFAKVVKLLETRSQDLGRFLTEDANGRQLPAYLARLADQLQRERSAGLKELAELKSHIDHLKRIVAMQQSHARVNRPAELVRVPDLLEEALRLNRHELSRPHIEIRQVCDPDLGPISIEKHKVLQILTNLIRNAKLACDESGRPDKQLILRAYHSPDAIKIAVSDNGVGIPPENLTRIFSHGFTTRKDGHGFGLHSGALTAKELGGSLLAHSDGPGLGATFTLTLPSPPLTTSHA